MIKSIKKEDPKDTENKKRSALFALAVLISRAFHRKEISWVIESMRIAQTIHEGIYFRILIRKYRFFQVFSALPSFAGIFFLGWYSVGENQFGRDVMKNISLVSRLIRNQKIDYTEIGFRIESIYYISIVILLCVVLMTISYLIFSFIIKNSPVIKNSLSLREYCYKKGHSKAGQDTVFLVTNAGTLIQSTEMQPHQLIEDKTLWKQLARTPKTPEEYSRDNSIIWIGNGFKLANSYPFTIK